ncbi:MAG: tetratricopeptide repeat protein [bacterium]
MKSTVLALGLVFFTAFMGAASCPKKKECRNPDFVHAMKDQIKLYYNKGDYIKALKTAKQAEECNPKDPELYYWIGLIYYKRGKTYDAISYFKKSLEKGPEYTDSHIALGMVYLELGRYDQALQHFKVASEDDLYEKPWTAYNNLGYTYMKKKNYSDAEYYFKKAIKANPKFCVAYCNLGELYSLKGDHEQAIRKLQKSVSLCPEGYARPRLLLAIEYGDMQMYSKACGQLYKASKIKDAPEAEQIDKYMRLYNCSSAITMP